ncbi:hypothetical protein [Streptomyces sp. NBC_00996]|uniref:hypothetical protein n=1 Tax=Streptomyces sp. NBC_00996 TaxID=2903710 RepID=UPI0038646BDF|nr:hypothetical protein OG390_09205 [Streptomyces sp. NBC_00996]
MTRKRPRLARNLLKTEYGLRETRRNGGAESTDTDSLWDQLRDAIRRLTDRLRGRSGATGGGGSSGQGDQGEYAQGGNGPAQDGYGPTRGGAGSAPAAAMTAQATTAPHRQSASEISARRKTARLEKKIDGLPKAEREAFEDEVLRRLRANDNWSAVFEESPYSMPVVAKYAVNAHLRESLRDIPPNVGSAKPEPGLPNGDTRRASMTTTTTTTTATSTEAEAEAQRKRWERPATPRDVATNDPVVATEQPPSQQRRSSFGAPEMSDISDGNAFLAAYLAGERARAAENNVVSLTPPPSPLSPPVSPELAPRSLPSDPPSPVSPLLPPSSLNPIGPVGHAIVNEPLPSSHGSSTPGSVNSPSRPASPGPGQPRANTSAKRR